MTDYITWNWEKPNALLENFCQSEEILYIDLTPQYREAIQHGGPPLYYHDDGHWNQQGHQLAAQCIYEILQENLL